MNTRNATILVFLALSVIISSVSALITRENLQTTLSPTAFARVRMTEIQAVEQAVVDNGCDTNLCFALQGGSDVSDDEYTEQKNFVDVVLQIIGTDKPANYAGVQYNSLATPISELTSDRDLYLDLVQNSRRVAGGTNIARGIRYCAKQMRPQDGSTNGDVNKMVVLGNGFATVGRNQIRAANRFITDGGHVCAISVGPSNEGALEELTKSPARILGIDDFFELSEIIVGLVQQVCDLPTAIINKV